MKNYGLNTTIAAALGVCLIGGDLATAQAQQYRDSRGRLVDNQGRIQVGRRYDRNQLRTNRNGYYRQRSQILGTELRNGGGTRIGGTRIDNDWQRWNSDHYARHSWRRGCT